METVSHSVTCLCSRLKPIGASQSLVTRTVESYLNEQRPSDGEIFRKIRLYARSHDLEGEKRWWSYLSNSKPKDLRQLSKNRELIRAFDALVDMPGLWSKVQLGALHRLLSLKCDEVSSAALYRKSAYII